MNKTFINIIYLGGIILSYNMGLYTDRMYSRYNIFIKTKKNINNNVLILDEFKQDDLKFKTKHTDINIVLNNLRTKLINIKKLTENKWIL